MKFLSVGETELTLPHYHLPIEIGDYFDKLIVTYHRLAKPSTSKEFVSKNKELGKDTIVGRGLAYLAHLGLMKRTPHGKFDLADPGQPIRTALASGDQGKAQEAWQEQLKKHRLFAVLQEYLESVKEMGTAVGFGSYVNDKVGKNWSKQFVNEGGKRFCSLLSSKGLIDYDDKTGNFSLRKIKPPSKEAPKEGVKALEKDLLRVWMDQTGNLNVSISNEYDVELSRKIVDMVLGARKQAGKN